MECPRKLPGSVTLPLLACLRFCESLSCIELQVHVGIDQIGKFRSSNEGKKIIRKLEKTQRRSG